MNVLKPRQPVPALDVATLDGHWSLADQAPPNFTMIVFYRGLHCPVCARYVPDLDKRLGEFEELGVTAIALSSDGPERAERARQDWGIERLTIGHGVTVDQARDWGLHRSAGRGTTSIGIEEPAEFNEPGLFIVRPDSTLYWAQISTMPFARPVFRELLAGLKFALDRDYPARGELS